MFDTKGILQALLDQGYRKVRDVYPDPRTAQRLRGGNRGPAAAEGIKNNVAFGDDYCVMIRSKKRYGLLSWVAETFAGLRVDWCNVVPNSLVRGLPSFRQDNACSRGCLPFVVTMKTSFCVKLLSSSL